MFPKRIVAVEGVVHSGKTTLCTTLRGQPFLADNIHFLPEYSAYAKDLGGFPVCPMTSVEALKSLVFFLRLEERRFRSIPQDVGLVVLDRSVLSLLAFDYALERFYGSKMKVFQETLRRVNHEWIPEVCLYLEISDETQMARHGFDNFHYEPLLLDPGFNAYLREFYSRIRYYFPRIEMVRINGESPPGEILAKTQLVITSFVAG